jgi:hypothetical protein
LDTFTLLRNAPVSSWLGIPILVLGGLWIGGLLAAAVWRIGHRAGSLVAHLSVALLGLALVYVTSFLLSSASHFYDGDEGWLYEWLGWFSFAMIDAAIFWSVLLIGIRVGLSLILVLFVVSFTAQWFCIIQPSLTLDCALFIGLPVWCIAVMGKEMLRIDLQKKHFDQLCCGESLDFKKYSNRHLD